MGLAKSADRPIPDEIWRANFTLPDGSFSGDKFEDLSIDLLKTLFNAGWSRTKKSHDGNKDFVLNFSSEAHWAESKSYREPISYHIVSPTLFMALLGDATTVIFLSRSRFKSTAKSLFSEYQRKTGKTVVCFDGALLDDLIGRSGEILKKYFPGHTHLAPAGRGVRCLAEVTHEVSRPPVLREEYLLQDGVPGRSNSSLTIGLGELIRLNVILINDSADQTATVTVCFAEDSPPLIGEAFEVESFAEKRSERQATLTLKPGEVRQISVLLRGVKPRPSTVLPALVVREGGREIAREALPAIEISRLYRIGMIGTAHHAACDAIVRQARNSRSHRIFQIVGRSGIGKSRLLQEIGAALLAEGYDLHRHDKEFAQPEASDLVLRGLLAGLNRLPLLPSGMESASDVDAETGNYGQDDAQLLARMIYQENSPLRKDPVLLAKALCRSVRSRKTALIIDNVQNLDDTFAATLDELVSRLNADDTEPPTILIFAFNEDLQVQGSAAAMLAKRLENEARPQDSEARIRSFRLDPFGPADVKAFVEAAVRGPAGGGFDLDHYPLSRNAFYEHIPGTPLHLWETLRCLRDTGVLRLDNDLLVIRDERDSTLAALLRTIPTKLAELLRKRWEEVRTATDRSDSGVGGDDLVRAMRTTCMLGRTSRVQLGEFGIPGVVTDQLIYVGLLQETGSGDVDFFHQQTFAFFLGELYRDFPAADAAKLGHALQRRGLDFSHFQQIFILHDLAGTSSPDLTARTAGILVRRGPSREYYALLFPALTRHLVRADQPLEGWVFQAFQAICDGYQQLESLRAGCDALENIYGTRILPLPADGLPGVALAGFLYRLVSALLSVAKDGRALEVVNQALVDLPAAAFTAPRDLALAEAKLINRKQSVIKGFGRETEALALAQLAFETAATHGDRGLQIEALMDSAEIWLAGEAPRAWSEGLDFYERALALIDGDLSLPDPVPVRSFVARSWIRLGARDWDGAIAIAGEGVRYAESIRNHFWQVRLRLMRTSAMLCAAALSGGPPDTAAHEIRVTQDVMNTYAAGRDLWANLYLAGKRHLLANEAGAAFNSFGAAIRIVANAAATPERLARRAVPMKDIAVSCRAATGDAAVPLFEALPPSGIRQECLAILRMDDGLFQPLAEAWQRSVLLCVPIRSGGHLTLTKL
ncbi:ATP-binding protein [Azospirillum sp. HJ39]|uniref:AAA family ATPase n=1 Tax=Azospirillum sp. HJ39 TaxID=3159496 RepID=UPI003558C4BE